MIRGNLASFSLGEIFQSLAVNNHTGTLKIVESDGTEKYVYFSQGEICLFSVKSHPSLRIGEILVRKGAITRKQLETALKYQETASEKLGQILIKKYGVSPEAIQDALVTKIYDEIYDLFLLTEAEFEFFVDHFPQEVFETFPENVRISINPQAVVMEGLRVSDEWKVIHKKIKTYNEIFTFNDSKKRKFRSAPDAALAEMIDGETPVRKLFDTFPGNRFECCKTTFGFLGAGLIRPLTLDECRQKGLNAAKRNNLEKAFDFLLYGVELSPGKPEPLLLIADLLEKMGRESEARTYQRDAVMLHASSGAMGEALKLGQVLIRHYPRDEEFLHVLFSAATHQRNLSMVESCGEALAQLLASRGEKQRAAEILHEVCTHVPRDTDRKIRAATLFRESNCSREAVALLEEVADQLSSRVKIGDKIKILRTIFELAPDRQDIKQEINNLLELQQRWDQRKKRRFTIAGILLIVLIVLLLVPLLYEIKARELMSHAQRLEEISKVSGDYAVAKSSYEEILEAYGWSTQARIAQDALDRIAAIERVQALALENEKNSILSQQDEKLQNLKTTITKLLELAHDMEERGDFEGAFGVLKKINTEFPEFPKTKMIPLPITITSSPGGCTVRVNGKEIGKTPVVVRERADLQIDVLLQHEGCEDLQRTIVTGQGWRVHFELNLRPLDIFELTGPVHLPLNAYGGDIFAVSRDGYIYSVNSTDQTVNWRRKLGEYGDLFSQPLYLPTEIVIGNVVGELYALPRSADAPRWRTSLKTTMLAAPAVSENGRWIAVADLNGSIFILENQSGKPKAIVRTENEIVHAPRFWGEHLVVASQDNTLYVLAVPDLRPVHAEFFEHDFDTELTVEHEFAYFGTRDGTLHCFNLLDHALTWSRPLDNRLSASPRAVGENILAVTSSGTLYVVDSTEGEVVWNGRAAESPPGEMLVHDGLAYFGTDEGEIIGFDLATRERSWLYRFDDSVQEAPVVIGDRLYFVSTSGRFVVMKIFRDQ